MGKLWSRLFKRHDNEGNNDISSLSERDESIDDDESTDESDNKTPDRRRRRVKKEEPTDGWEEICGIDIDVLQDIMVTKTHKIRHSNKYISVKDIKVPTVDENRERLSGAYNLWLKYCPDDCQEFLPNWERILEKPLSEQSVLVDEYVKKVFYFLKFEEVPEYNIPPDINKEEVLIRDPNKPGKFIKLTDALVQQRIPSIKNNKDSCMEIFSNMPGSSHFKGDESKPNLKLVKRNYSHHTV